MVLEEMNPEAYAALPECYRNDHALEFFIDNNGNLCAEHDLHNEEYVWNNGKWYLIGTAHNLEM